MIISKEDRIRQYTVFMGITEIPQIVTVEKLDKLGFFDSPASTRYHGAYSGGLFDHSFTVAKTLVDLTERLGLTWDDPRSPYLIGMFHDLCKCGLYFYNQYTDRYEHTSDLMVPGHGDKSVIMLQDYIKLTEEELLCIRWHMGAYERNPKMWTYYGRAIERYPNVLYTHTADMIASKVLGV